LMDDKFDTRGRSVSLINNPKTLETTPLATKSNLALVLQQIGQKMNRDEDVLFLYLTSHGSRTHELSVSFWPLSLNQVTPEDLRTALDQAGIKWRVLLVSACYSGGFLEPLKNSTTLVMTAAAADKTSFGCGAKSDFTYFGQEVFKGQLAHSYSFIPAFETAMANIAQREKRENLQPSMPQLYVGPEVGPKLEMLEKELRQFYADSSAHYMNSRFSATVNTWGLTCTGFCLVNVMTAIPEITSAKPATCIKVLTSLRNKYAITTVNIGLTLPSIATRGAPIRFIPILIRYEGNTVQNSAKANIIK